MYEWMESSTSYFSTEQIKCYKTTKIFIGMEKNTDPSVVGRI